MEKPAFTEEQRAYFRAANARRRRAEGTCDACGAPIPAALSWQRYCSARCRTRETSRVYRERQRAQRTPDEGQATPAAVSAAPATSAAPAAAPALAPGDRVVLLQPVEDVSAGAHGRILQLGADGLANVDFGTDVRPRERRAPLASLQPAP